MLLVSEVSQVSTFIQQQYLHIGTSNRRFLGQTIHNIGQLDVYKRQGNLFIGSFDVSNAMSNPLKATKFGLPFRHVPPYLAGYYKYKAGDQFTEGGKDVYKRQLLLYTYVHL